MNEVIDVTDDMSSVEGLDDGPVLHGQYTRSISTWELRKHVVQQDHRYCQHWGARGDRSGFQPCRLLLVNPARTPIPEPADCWVDVESVDADDDLERCSAGVAVDVDDSTQDGWATSALNECQNYVQLARDQPDDLIEEMDTSSLTTAQRQLLSEVLSALCDYRLARLALSSVRRGAFMVRSHGDRCAWRVRRALTAAAWERRLCQWLHLLLLQKLGRDSLALYLDVLQTLCASVPVLVQRLLSGVGARQGSLSTDALVTLLRRPWNPAEQIIRQHKPERLSGGPLLVWIPCCAREAALEREPPPPHRRLGLWLRKLAQLGNVVPVSLPDAPSVAGASRVGASVADVASDWLARLVTACRRTVSELRRQEPGRPLFLVGWRLGALLASHLCLVEAVSGCVCVAPPLRCRRVPHRGLAGDPLLDARAPHLFVLGQRARDASVELVELMRDRLSTETRLLVVGGANSQLLVSEWKRHEERITQSMVDLSILDEIGDFMRDVLSKQSDGVLPVLCSTAAQPPILTEEDTLKLLTRQATRKYRPRGSVKTGKKRPPLKKSKSTSIQLPETLLKKYLCRSRSAQQPDEPAVVAQTDGPLLLGDSESQLSRPASPSSTGALESVDSNLVQTATPNRFATPVAAFGSSAFSVKLKPSSTKVSPHSSGRTTPTVPSPSTPTQPSPTSVSTPIRPPPSPVSTPTLLPPSAVSTPTLPPRSTLTPPPRFTPTPTSPPNISTPTIMLPSTEATIIPPVMTTSAPHLPSRVMTPPSTMPTATLPRPSTFTPPSSMQIPTPRPPSTVRTYPVSSPSSVATSTHHGHSSSTILPTQTTATRVNLRSTPGVIPSSTVRVNSPSFSDATVRLTPPSTASRPGPPLKIIMKPTGSSSPSAALRRTHPMKVMSTDVRIARPAAAAGSNPHTADVLLASQPQRIQRGSAAGGWLAPRRGQQKRRHSDMMQATGDPQSHEMSQQPPVSPNRRAPQDVVDDHHRVYIRCPSLPVSGSNVVFRQPGPVSRPRPPIGPRTTVTPRHPNGSRTTVTPRHPYGSRTTVTPRHPAGARTTVTPRHPYGSRTTITPRQSTGARTTVTPRHPIGPQTTMAHQPAGARTTATPRLVTFVPSMRARSPNTRIITCRLPDSKSENHPHSQ